MMPIGSEEVPGVLSDFDPHAAAALRSAGPWAASIVLSRGHGIGQVSKTSHAGFDSLATRDMLIAIEGPDGCGKSTVARQLAARLSCPLQAFPDRTTPIGLHIDRMLKDPDHDPHVLQALQTANRFERIDVLTAPGPVVLDRYWHSGWVYSCAAGLDMEWVGRVTGATLPSADVNVLLDAPPEVNRERRKRGPGSDAYDGKPLDWYREIARLYRSLWDLGQRELKGSWLTFDTQLCTTDEIVAGIAAVVAVAERAG